ncbi:MAG: alpha-N-acetylglucosaminidase C-terminal domain-containing protein, partial [Bacteroidales bacterium]|nr:alpha-N-acetylglucosaminidase C-terminal domain-containing protein [Candidatus Sodaliphilus aphodohippi]
MKQRILLLLAALMVTVTAVAADDVAVAKALAGRLSTRLADKVEFVQKKSAVDQFTMSGRKGKVVITANNANSMAVGLNHYLQNYCLTNVSWYSNVAVELPDQLPDVKKSVTIKARVPQRFFLNYCTFGYTMPFWQWTEWERLIDWMALNGINMPLAITGQESVWAKVWRQIGLSQKDIDEYFTGPVYLAWHRMANIDGWSGPLPQHWLDSQEQLQKQILARERELNMRPVLNAFAGHVPKKIMELYPDADIKPLEKWDNFPDRYNTVFLNSEDPLYSKIQKIFLDEQTKMYGTDHIYGIDPFNEMTPPSMEADYLANVTKHIYESLTAADPEAEWLQMGWFLYHQRKDYTPERVKAMMESLPKGKMLMLDYFCERTELWRMRDKFSGQPYVWCFLGNFGGATAVQGNVKAAGDKLEKALQEGGDNLVGIGATPEGLDVQQYPLEYIFRKAWTGMADNDTYIKQVARRHAGFDSPAAEEAWKLLQDSIYIGIPYTRGPLFNFRGEFGQDKTAWTRSDIFYKPANMVKAWELLLSQPAVKRDAMNLDLICVGREILGQLFRLEKIEFDKAVQAIDAPAAHKHGEALLGIIKDADRLAAHNTNCTMQKWIKQSRDYGVTKAEKDYYEMNARRLVTIWGGDLCDYANRAWA